MTTIVNNETCKCGNTGVRLVECGAGVYIRCPICDKGTYMCQTKEEALRKWKEKNEQRSCR